MKLILIWIEHLLSNNGIINTRRARRSKTFSFCFQQPQRNRPENQKWCNEMNVFVFVFCLLIWDWWGYRGRVRMGVTASSKCPNRKNWKWQKRLERRSASIYRSGWRLWSWVCQLRTLRFSWGRNLWRRIAGARCSASGPDWDSWWRDCVYHCGGWIANWADPICCPGSDGGGYAATEWDSAAGRAAGWCLLRSCPNSWLPFRPLLSPRFPISSSD